MCLENRFTALDIARCASYRDLASCCCLLNPSLSCVKSRSYVRPRLETRRLFITGPLFRGEPSSSNELALAARESIGTQRL